MQFRNINDVLFMARAVERSATLNSFAYIAQIAALLVPHRTLPACYVYTIHTLTLSYTNSALARTPLLIVCVLQSECHVVGKCTHACHSHASLASLHSPFDMCMDAILCVFLYVCIVTSVRAGNVPFQKFSFLSANRCLLIQVHLEHPLILFVLFLVHNFLILIWHDNKF